MYDSREVRSSVLASMRVPAPEVEPAGEAAISLVDDRNATSASWVISTHCNSRHASSSAPRLVRVRGAQRARSTHRPIGSVTNVEDTIRRATVSEGRFGSHAVNAC